MCGYHFKKDPLTPKPLALKNGNIQRFVDFMGTNHDKVLLSNQSHQFGSKVFCSELLWLLNNTIITYTIKKFNGEFGSNL
jgi:hypothetical protein